MLHALALLVACNGDANAPPPRPEGLLQVIQVERTGGDIVEGHQAFLDRQPNCLWAREAWRFADDHFTVQNDFLCPSGVPNESFACTIRVRVDAAWDATTGSFRVERRFAGQARFIGVGDPTTDGERTRCALAIEPGEYRVSRVRNGQWKWELRGPSGDVLRLDPGDERPDFTAAVNRVEAAP
jgi:hypothetical protein